LEHQVGPPRFMADMVRRGIRAAMRKRNILGAAHESAVRSLHKKIADPLHPAHVTRHRHGFALIRFNAEERLLLELVDLDAWYVPHPATPWFAASTAVIDGDSLVNYVTADGVGKIVAICGPGTPFEDPTVFHSMFSCGASYVDAVTVMSDVAMGAVEQRLAQTRQVIDNVRTVVGRQITRGYLAFAPEEWPGVVRSEGVDVSVLRVRRIGNAVVVTVPLDEDGCCAFWDAPLVVDANSDQREVAKLIRHKVASLMRSI
jgi:hypothetical protein